MAALCLTFWGAARLFSRMSAVRVWTCSENLLLLTSPRQHSAIQWPHRPWTESCQPLGFWWFGSWVARVWGCSPTHSTLTPVSARPVPGIQESLGLISEQLLYNVSLQDFSTPLPTLFIIFLIIAILVCVQIYLCDSALHSLMTNRLEHLFLCLLAICILSGEMSI